MNRWINNLFVISLVVLLLSSLVWAQPKAVIQVVGKGPDDVAGTSNPKSTCLSVVGLGETIYFKGMESAGAAVTTYEWSLGGVPAGSTVALTTTNLDTTRLVPDAVGQFEVKLTITTAAGGTASTSLIVTSAKWVGVGGQSGLPVDFMKGQCALCHSTNTFEWSKTPHATMFSQAIDGSDGQSYKSYCISCHTVGYNTAPTAVNDGFDDVALELGWVFPSPLQAGNWTSMVANSPKLAHLANIQCENCHGPGSQHFGNTSKIDMTLDATLCGSCHKASPYHVKSAQWEASLHANELVETSASCQPCHSGWAFVRKNDPLVLDNRPTSGSYKISCAVCHDPHNGSNDFQLRTLADITLSDNKTVIRDGGTGKLCMQCHKSRRDAVTYASTASNISSHFGPHNSQADMLFSANAITYGLPVGHAGHQNVVEEGCNTCHMAPTPAAGKPGANKVGEHTFAVKNGEVDNVAVCQTCHGEVESFEEIPAAWDYDEDGTVESAEEEIEGLLEELGNLLPPAGPSVAFDKSTYDWTGLTNAKEVEYRKLLLKAGFNYAFVEEDRSSGIHNTAYAATLLRRSIASLTMGDLGAGQIASIVDVPNDDGKQVLVTWSKFAADGLSDNPILNYNVWLRLDLFNVGKSASTNAKVYNSIETMSANAQPGALVTMDNETWLFVKTVPAAAMDNYTVIAPTLFDSTKVDGLNWSVFKVTGHTKNTYWYATTAPDSGYSIDNLAPSAPMNLMAQQSVQGVVVKWEPALEKDFKYYALYKGETASFDPAASQPIAKLTQSQYTDANVQLGKTYYYKVTTFDYAGNNSLFSMTLLNITGVLDVNVSGIPTNFELGQNYPNPFNPSTTISFGLPKQQHIQVKVYDLRGALVRTITSGFFSPGRHQLMWDGRNDSGRLVGAGTYIYRLESEDVTINKKMIFLK